MVAYGPPPEALDGDRRVSGRAQARIATGRSRACRRWSRRCAQKLTTENRLDLSRSRVFVTAGGNLAFMNAVLAVADPGDEIDPAGAVLLQSRDGRRDGRLPAGGGAQPTRSISSSVDAIAAAITPRTRAIVTISPNNPSGAVYPRRDLRAVNALCAARGV